MPASAQSAPSGGGNGAAASKVEAALEEAKAASKQASSAAAQGDNARAGEIEERAARELVNKVTPIVGNDVKLGVLVLILASENDRRAAEYHAKANNYARAADAMERVVQLHTKLGTSSPHANELSRWRTNIAEWRSRASTPPPSAQSNSGLDAVNRALELNEQGRSSEALLILDSALPQLDSAPTKDAALVVKANLVAAGIYDDALLPTKAEARLKRAVAAAEAAVGSKDKALIEPLSRLATHHMNHDEHEHAAPHYMRAYDIALASAPDKLAEAIIGLSRVLVARKDHKEAILLMQRARAILSMNNTGPQAAFTYMFSSMSLASMYEAIDRFDEAAKLLEEVREVFEPMYRSSPDKLGLLWASYATSVGWHWRKRGDFVKAERYMRESLAIVSKVYPKESLTTANSECSLGEVFWASGDLERSLDPIGHCFDLREKNISRILASGSEEQKRAYVQGFLVAYEKTMTAQIRAGNKSPRLNRLAMNQVLRTKGRILDAVTGESVSIRRNADEQTRTLLDRLAATRTTLAGLSTSGRETDRIKLLEEESRTLETELSSKSAGFKLATKDVSIATVRAAIPSGAALVEIVAFRPLDPLYRTMSDQEEQRYIAYVLHGDGADDPVAIDLGPSAPIDRVAADLRKALSDPTGDPLAPGTRLYQQVIRPLEPHFRGKTHLIVSPDGALNTIPFAAMRKNDSFLVSSYTFTYVTSGRDLLRWGGAGSGSTGQGDTKGLVVLADPDFAMNGATSGSSSSAFARVKFPPLPGTATEADAIHSLFARAVVMKGREATEGRLKRLQHPRVLHLATHGFFLDTSSAATNTRGLELDEGVKESVNQAENPLLRSGLALAGASSLKGNDSEDGILTALEAASLDLSGTKLVVLSACQTAQGEARNGEGVYGLRRALSMAGAETLVMSLWSVDDEATSYLMQGYYKRLRASRGRSEALRDVQLEMASSKNVSHPYYWAAFIPSGDPGSMALSDEDYAAAPAPMSSSRPAQTKDEPAKERRDDFHVEAPSSTFELGFHYMATSNLLAQADREGGLVSLDLGFPVLSRVLHGSRFGLRDVASTTFYGGLRTSTAVEYPAAESEGSLGYGARLGYEAALGVRASERVGVFAGAQAAYNTLVMGDVRTYGVTVPLVALVDLPFGDVPVGLRGSYGKWLVDQEIIGASASFGFDSISLRLGVEQLKMPTTVSSDGVDGRASAGRQVSTIGTFAIGGLL